VVITVAKLSSELCLGFHNSDNGAHNYGNYHNHDDDHRGNDDYHSLDDE